MFSATSLYLKSEMTVVSGMGVIVLTWNLKNGGNHSSINERAISPRTVINMAMSGA